MDKHKFNVLVSQIDYYNQVLKCLLIDDNSRKKIEAVRDEKVVELENLISQSNGVVL